MKSIFCIFAVMALGYVVSDSKALDLYEKNYEQNQNFGLSKNNLGNSKSIIKHITQSIKTLVYNF